MHAVAPPRPPGYTNGSTPAAPASGVILPDPIPATPGTSVFIPQGTLHRATAGSSDLLLVEVQRGAVLREDDIERFADDFGRAGESAAG